MAAARPAALGHHRLQGSRNLDRLDDILLTLLLSPTGRDGRTRRSRARL